MQVSAFKNERLKRRTNKHFGLLKPYLEISALKVNWPDQNVQRKGNDLYH